MIWCKYDVNIYFKNDNRGIWRNRAEKIEKIMERVFWYLRTFTAVSSIHLSIYLITNLFIYFWCPTFCECSLRAAWLQREWRALFLPQLIIS